MKLSSLFLVIFLIIILVVIFFFLNAKEEPKLFEFVGRKYCLYLHKSRIIESNGNLIITAKTPHELHILNVDTRDKIEIYTNTDYKLPKGKIYITRLSFWDIAHVDILGGKCMEHRNLTHERKPLEEASLRLYNEFVGDGFTAFNKSIFQETMMSLDTDFKPSFFSITSFITKCYNSVLVVVKDNDYTRCNLLCYDSGGNDIPLPKTRIFQDIGNVRVICIPFANETTVEFNSATAYNATVPYYCVFASR